MAHHKNGNGSRTLNKHLHRIPRFCILLHHHHYFSPVAFFAGTLPNPAFPCAQPTKEAVVHVRQLPAVSAVIFFFLSFYSKPDFSCVSREETSLICNCRGGRRQRRLASSFGLCAASTNSRAASGGWPEWDGAPAASAPERNCGGGEDCCEMGFEAK